MGAPEPIYGESPLIKALPAIRTYLIVEEILKEFNNRGYGIR